MWDHTAESTTDTRTQLSIKLRVDALNYSLTTASNMSEKHVEIVFTPSWACFSSHRMAVPFMSLLCGQEVYQLLKLGTQKWMQATMLLLWHARSGATIGAPSQNKITSGIPSVSSPKELKLRMLSWLLSNRVWLNAWPYFSGSCWVIATWKGKPFGHPV